MVKEVSCIKVVVTTTNTEIGEGIDLVTIIDHASYDAVVEVRHDYQN